MDLILGEAAIFAACDAAVVACALYCAFTNRRAHLRGCNQSAIAQCASTVLIILAFSSRSPHSVTLLASAAVAVLPLIAQHPQGYIVFWLASLLGAYRTLLDPHSGLWLRIFGASMHISLLLANLGAGGQRALRRLLDMLFYTKARRLFSLSKTHKLTLDDIPELPERLRLGVMHQEFKYDVNETLFLIRAIVRMVWRPLLPFYALLVVTNFLRTAIVILEGIVLSSLDNLDGYPWYHGYLAALGLLVVQHANEYSDGVWRSIDAEMSRATSALEMELFRLPLVPGATTVSRDIGRSYRSVGYFRHTLGTIYETLDNCIGLFAAFWPVYYRVGWLVLIPVGLSLGTALADRGFRMLVGERWRWSRPTYTYDSKVNDIYHGIKSIKLFGWEQMFLSRKIQQREAEDDDRLSWYALVVQCVWKAIDIAEVVTSYLASYIVIDVFTRGQTIASTSATAAPAFTNANMFQLNSHIENMRSSIERLLTTIYRLREMVSENIAFERTLRGITVDALPQSQCDDEKVRPSVSIESCEFRWKVYKPPVLSDISFSAVAGQLVAVVGKTGSGKSTLLQSICGEVEMTKGSGGVVGTVGYLEQSPWIMNATFRDNVVFGRAYDKGLFDKVIYACALTEDLAEWPDRDLTIIGDRGINISGGQRARLALARTLYSQADIYVLDDPLSAVDAHVKRHLLEHVILDTGMLAGKLRIVSTHMENFLPFAHQVIELADSTATVTQQEPQVYNPIPQRKLSQDSHASSASESSSATVVTDPPAAAAATTKKDIDSIPVVKHGLWENSLYVLRLCGAPIVMVMAISSFIGPITKFVLGGRELDALRSKKGFEREALLGYLRVRMVSEALENVIRRAEFMLRRHIADNYLEAHIKRMFAKSLIFAPASLFDSITSQQVWSAYHEGAQTLANRAPEFIQSELSRLVDMAFSIWRVGHSAPLLLMTVPLIGMATQMRNQVVDPVRSMLRTLEHNAQISNNRVSDTIADGTQMIRLFGVHAHFTDAFMHAKDVSESVNRSRNEVSVFGAAAYYAVRRGGRMVVSWIMLAQSQLTVHRISSGESKTYQQLLHSLIDTTSGVVNFSSRIRRFSDSIDQFRQFVSIPAEAPYIVDDCRPSSMWPERGHIEIRDFSMKYREDLDASLKDINLTIRAGEKIGVVGRTGSGKSSLAKSLFRLGGPHTTGEILIDGQDISAMGVGDLRPRLGIIPQEACMFDGSYKKNLDPLYQYSVEDIWGAVLKCNIAEKVSPKRSSHGPVSRDYDYRDERYDMEVKEAEQRWSKAGWAMRFFLLAFVDKPQKPYRSKNNRYGLNRYVFGHNSFSNGEQQLFSLCRLLMRKRRIIVLDEATAEVDLETDGKVQRLIRDEFSHCTILTIAHRLETIMNSDRIVVMDKGRVVEVGPPQQLIERGGYFADLVKTNGFND